MHKKREQYGLLSTLELKSFQLTVIITILKTLCCSFHVEDYPYSLITHLHNDDVDDDDDDGVVGEIIIPLHGVGDYG